MSEPTEPSGSSERDEERERRLSREVASRFEPRPDPEHLGKEASASSRLFDLRLMIGTLFGIYGILLTIYSFFDSQAEIDRAAGIHLNLWLGLSMLLVCVIFFGWARLQPQKPPEPGEPTVPPENQQPTAE
jgi:hypothetical protein